MTSKTKVQKKRTRSVSSISTQKSETGVSPNIDIPPCDTLVVKILSLRLPDEDPKHFAIKVTYFDQLILNAIIKSISAKAEEHTQAIAQGTLNYDPSDYEKMCLFADAPLVVNIQPLRSIQSEKNRASTQSLGSSGKLNTFTRHLDNISCCNVDILSIFLGEEENQLMCIKKRMEPLITPSMSHRKSWDNLPLLTMELKVERNTMNVAHHSVLKNANWMKLTLIAAYNMIVPFDEDYTYTAASKTPLFSESNDGLVTFNQGYREPKRFNATNFFPQWETLRIDADAFTKGDQKLFCNLEDIENNDDIDLPYYMQRILPYHTAVWGSFHRTLMLGSERWMYKRIRQYKWPLEIHMYGETGGYSYMGFLNLFRLLYPGEHTVCAAVPLYWINAATMMQECGCNLLLTPNDKAPSSLNEKTYSPTPATQRASRLTTESVPTSISTLTGQWRATGADDNCAFVIVHVKLGRPLKSIVIPPMIFKQEITDMLREIEIQLPHKRECTGRGQLERNWQNTIRSAASSLRKVPYYGTTEFCTFNRQLSETRTRVELMTSCWQDAAIFINNNFVVQQYLHSDDVFEELVMMSHACLMRSAYATMMGSETWKDVNPILRAARHARQMQDTHHAMELFLQLIVDHPRHVDYWRELSTCLKDLDRDWANACLNKSIVLNPRHPLTLVSKGATLFEEDPTAAEPFFRALLAFYPSWNTAWVIASAYYHERELFHMADIIMDTMKRNDEQIGRRVIFTRAWEQELGDWWDHTPLLLGMSPFYDAADLLLRLRAVPLAEVCLARALAETGESAEYYHLVSLCCRLRGEFKEALCLVTTGLQKFGENNYLRSLEAECLHRLENIQESMLSFEKAGGCISAFNILMSMPSRDVERARPVLVDLVRRQPSAYAWTALAYDWLNVITKKVDRGNKSKINSDGINAGSKSSAIASAIQALKIDRRAGRAWIVLAKLVQPSARRVHCVNMANMCGFKVTAEELQNAATPTMRTTCHLVGTALRECRCQMCENMKM